MAKGWIPKLPESFSAKIILDSRNMADFRGKYVPGTTNTTLQSPDPTSESPFEGACNLEKQWGSLKWFLQPRFQVLSWEN